MLVSFIKLRPQIFHKQGSALWSALSLLLSFFLSISTPFAECVSSVPCVKWSGPTPVMQVQLRCNLSHSFSHVLCISLAQHSKALLPLVSPLECKDFFPRVRHQSENYSGFAHNWWVVKFQLVYIGITLQ